VPPDRISVSVYEKKVLLGIWSKEKFEYFHRRIFAEKMHLTIGRENHGQGSRRFRLRAYECVECKKHTFPRPVFSVLLFFAMPRRRVAAEHLFGGSETARAVFEVRGHHIETSPADVFQTETSPPDPPASPRLLADTRRSFAFENYDIAAVLREICRDI